MLDLRCSSFRNKDSILHLFHSFFAVPTTSPLPHPAASASAAAAGSPSAAAAEVGAGGGLFPSFRYNNNRNFWLEYSTPPSTTFPEYDEEYYETRTTTADPGPYFVDAAGANNTVVEVPLGATVFLDCVIGALTDEFQVIKSTCMFKESNV